MVFAWFLVSLHLARIVLGKTCDDAFECEYETLSDDVICYGYGSCKDSIINTQNTIHCDGDHSCYSATMASGLFFLYTNN